ncbi:MAG: DUF2793 domain-containing protein [Dinoroseobacter sp.]|nr:DUF2793 domain-containing protein [Dinoroseobacter sp.]
MPNTANLGLPLLEAAQSQKHVTVNEAFAGVDALCQLVLQSLSVSVPPVAPPNGSVYAIPPGAQAPWSNHSGALATYSNGGWLYIQPRLGWRAWLAEIQASVIYDGSEWVPETQSAAPSGALSDLTPLEISHQVLPGATGSTTLTIPENSLVFGITARVTSAITGSLSSWRLGVAGADDRYGSGLGTGLNSYVLGLTGTPMTYYSNTPLQLTAEGGTFNGGEVTLVIHLLRLQLPKPV